MASASSPRRGITLQRQLAQVPITSVAVCSPTPGGNKYFLAGQDGNLAIYEDTHRPSQEPVFMLPVFEDQPIHGIRLWGSRLLLWGAARIALFDAGPLAEGQQPALLATATAPDWVYDAAISPFCEDQAVLATAHNEVVVVQYRRGTLSLGNAVSPSRPFLYAAHLTWVSASRVLVAAGTVFGDVLVWEYSIAEEEHSLAFVLRGHEGSIYGVDISSPLLLPDGTTRRLLASCSDDRTIRVWDISLDGAAASRSRAGHAGAQRGDVVETGFKAAQSYHVLHADAGGEGETVPVAVAMGHASRIWGVRFAAAVDSDSDSKSECALDGSAPLWVYSFGEDSTTQRWKLDLDLPPPDVAAPTTRLLTGRLTHQQTYSLHQGKHLWARALDVHAGGVDILTGGADSKISVIREPAHSLRGHGEKHRAGCMTINVPDVLRALSRGQGNAEQQQEQEQEQEQAQEQEQEKEKGGPSRELFSRYDFISENRILAITNAGRLFVGDLSTQTWEQVNIEEGDMVQDLKRCYVLRTVNGHDGAAVIGTTNGKVYFFIGDDDDDDGHRGQLPKYRLVCAAAVPGRITEINHLTHGHHQQQQLLISILVHIHASSVSHLLTLNTSGTLLQRAHLAGLDARFVAVSAARLDDDLIILGSRHGYMSLLTLQNDDTWQPILAVATRSRDAITSIVPLPAAAKEQQQQQQSTTAPCPYVLATSRDGKYRIYRVDRTSPSLVLVHETAPPFGPMIEGAWFTAPTPTSSSTSTCSTTATSRSELVLYGFRSKDFVIWNESTREELATVDCGGAHRTFRLHHDDGAEPHRYRFAYTRTSKLCVFSQQEVPHRTVRRGTHGREIRALCANKQFVASGAEDTSIRIWEVTHAPSAAASAAGDAGGPTMRSLACIKAHVTGLQKLQWFEDEYLLSSGGNEEFYVWRMTRLDDSSAYAGLAVVCEAVLTDKSPVGDLRIMDFDVSRVVVVVGTGDDGQAEGQEAGQGEEGRHSKSMMIVTMAFSNSSFKTYEYDCRGGGSFRCLAEGRYTGACITQLRHLGVEAACGSGSGGKVLHVMTASTDGHLVLWGGIRLDGDGVGVQRYSLKAACAVHQSSIKSLDMSRDGTHFRVVTGGDDNAIGIVLVAEVADEDDDEGPQGGTGTGTEGRTETCTEGRTTYAFVSRGIVRRAHTAAVNGVALLPGAVDRHDQDSAGASREMLAVSVSNDQRVKMWRISVDAAQGVRVSLAACMSSGVADPGDVAVLDRGQIVVGGVGLEVWRVHSSAMQSGLEKP
ncbi:hypothetical protein E4U43_002745 [Claviceps pusilla]|uniref:WD repeat protein WDR6 n=1 Tax=Claviceps pusilla TaxID=123648 RepID=A0A9P7SV25_9HYPO|nr:hypothetical protein E4U43_002745 [Claviceps pusilla]